MTNLAKNMEIPFSFDTLREKTAFTRSFSKRVGVAFLFRLCFYAAA